MPHPPAPSPGGEGEKEYLQGKGPSPPGEGFRERLSQKKPHQFYAASLLLILISNYRLKSAILSGYKLLSTFFLISLKALTVYSTSVRV